ncbi:AAA family ATPase [Streptomyces sp. NPDC058322]|uniref:AAA family ATPase n=1 Tax=unclassified Streptomyces TaxID=2593676 RepID=UPI0036E39DE0
MRNITQASIKGLFGYVDHDVQFSKNSPITIISGPNGIGKTHFLRLLYALTTLDLKTLATVEFRQIEIHLKDRNILRLAQKRDGDEVVGFKFSEKQSPRRTYKVINVPYAENKDIEQDLPPNVVQLADGSWYDTRYDRPITSQFAQRRYGISVTPNSLAYFEGSWLGRFFTESKSILIDTQRLENSSTPSRAGSDVRPVRQYITQVAAQLSDARRKSLNESLRADQTFAVRVLKKARTTINEKDLKERYQRIADQHAELHASGLNVSPVDVQFPDGKTSPTERRILNVFLDDWERKLQPLLPTHEKLKTLRRIVESKFIGKELVLTQRGQIRFRSKYNGKPLSVNSLSSGEQHLLAVFTMLLFAASEGSLVLVDEPEISMHAAWKHSFLNDITEVANISNMQIVIATHSSAIINGNWDIVQEIKAPLVESQPEVDDTAFDDIESEV